MATIHIHMTDGTHLTATERRSIAQIIAAHDTNPSFGVDQTVGTRAKRYRLTPTDQPDTWHVAIATWQLTRDGYGPGVWDTIRYTIRATRR